MRAATWLVLAAVLAIAPAARAQAGSQAPATSSGAPAHASRMRDISREGPYPRFTRAQLEASGYPDHLHAFFWPGWRPPVGTDGQPYGPYSLCDHGKPAPWAGLAIEPGRLARGPFEFTYAPRFLPCEAVLVIELCEWARVRCHDLLGLEAKGKLAISDPDSLPRYLAATGYGAGRPYKLQGDACVLQPFWILAARTLISHAVTELVTEWTLAGTTRGELPVWLSHGLAAYVADDGVHLNNFMAPLRPDGQVLMRPAEVVSALSSGADADQVRDQKRYRRASYSAFLMTWRLVEDQGGLAKLDRLLGAVAGGQPFATACRKVYGASPEALAARLDPVARGEPIGTAVQPRDPHLPPGSPH